ncbi:unnamed protein product [Closterium sp. Naga37s-1]|nr:unnamed protein product [Closterium sp. Naga37s-1]
MAATAGVAGGMAGSMAPYSAPSRMLDAGARGLGAFGLAEEPSHLCVGGDRVALLRHSAVGAGAVGAAGNNTVELGAFGLSEELSQLRRDRGVLMRELLHSRQQAAASAEKLALLEANMAAQEQRQAHMTAFLAGIAQLQGQHALLRASRDSSSSGSGSAGNGGLGGLGGIGGIGGIGGSNGIGGSGGNG